MSKLWLKDNKLLLKDNKLQLADKCCCDGGGEEPCTGQDPLCEDCICDSRLSSTYMVTISGMSSCTAEGFNGTWTLPYINLQCFWSVIIDNGWKKVTLHGQSDGIGGVAWLIGLAHIDDCGYSFAGYTGETPCGDCDPTCVEYWFMNSNCYGCTMPWSAVITVAK